jgi:hypothetical protein
MSTFSVRRWRTRAAGGALVAAAALLSGCATVKLGEPAPRLETLQLIREAGIGALAVGDFRPAATLKPAADKSVSARGSTVGSPVGDSFAAYLRESLMAQLRAAGSFDAAAAVSIGGELTRSELHESLTGTSTAAVAARFVVRRGDAIRYEREHTVSAQWQSSFIGAVAIPRAFDEYGDLYRKLVEQLLHDPEFAAACRGP